MDRITTIFFDAVGTLIRVRGSVGQVYSRIARHHGTPVEPEELDDRFRNAFARRSAAPLPKDAQAGAERWWWFELVRETAAGLIPDSRIKPYFDELYEFFGSAGAWLLYPDVKPELERLRAGRFRLGIISNFDSRLVTVLAELGVGRFFDRITLSWETGASKPDLQIFRKALEDMQAAPDEAMHVGDSVSEDVNGAERAGMLPILLDRRDTRREWTRTVRIRSLAELPV